MDGALIVMGGCMVVVILSLAAYCILAQRYYRRNRLQIVAAKERHPCTKPWHN